MDTRVRHEMTGHMNPHCRVCRRTAMQIARRPLERCERMTLPFDEVRLKPEVAALQVRKEQAS